MFTTTLAFALASLLSSTTLDSLSWHADYRSAQLLAKEGGKPLAVFVGSGTAGWNLVSQDRELGKDLKQLLAKEYICVYVDTALEAGKELASDFQVPDGLGLIVSDLSGKYQAFRHEGDLPSQQLLRYLSRYADPERIVLATETNAADSLSEDARQRYAPAFRSYYQPSRYSPVFPGGSGRSC